jgi:hypothetical protein
LVDRVALGQMFQVHSPPLLFFHSSISKAAMWSLWSVAVFEKAFPCVINFSVLLTTSLWLWE